MGTSHLWEVPPGGRMLVELTLRHRSNFEDYLMNWQYTGKETEPDSKNRVSLGTVIRTPPGVRYRVMHNEVGQILLDPVKSVPAYEAWVWENEERIASIKRGIAQAEAGRVVRIDLAAYGDDDKSEDE